MTTNDYDARLARLKAATKGDTVTVPDGWEKPELDDDAPHRVQKANLRPGDVFIHDGTHSLQWRLDPADRQRAGNPVWSRSEDCAALGLDVDHADEHINDEWDTTDVDDEDDAQHDYGTVSVRIVPDTSGFVEAVEQAATEAAAAAAGGFQLDDYQLERVAALEQALRVLEKRRAPRGGNVGIAAAFKGTGPTVPIVPAGDLVDVAAFVYDGDTGREPEVRA